MRVSKFLKDLVFTGLNQVIVLAMGVVLLKFLSAAFSETNFGLFNVVRRWDIVLIPLITLNLNLGLSRYVSYEKENDSFYLHFTLIITTAFCILLSPPLFLFPSFFSKLLFDSAEYGDMVMILTLFLLANVLHLIAYSYFRGKMNMNVANSMRSWFFGFPLLPAAAAALYQHKTGHFAPSSYLNLFFLLYSLFGIFLSLFYLRHEVSLATVKTMFKVKRAALINTFKQGQNLLIFSLARMPAVFFMALIFSFPVFYANYMMSLVLAGYLGIVVSVLRLFEIFSMPFNMIFLPKFSGLLRDKDSSRIHEYCQVVLDFIFTFLPFAGVLAFGLMPFVVHIWFGNTYTITTSSVAVSVLCSVFYLAFALIRGILDGLFEYPYTNEISLASFLFMAVLSLIIGGDTYNLTIAFCSGLIMLGLLSTIVLVKKLRLVMPWLVLVKALLIAILLFTLLRFVDQQLADLGFKGMRLFAIQLGCRLLLVGALWFFYWRKSHWYKEVLKRFNISA